MVNDFKVKVKKVPNYEKRSEYFRDPIQCGHTRTISPRVEIQENVSQHVVLEMGLLKTM